MPFVSKAQERWGHSPAGKRALGGGQAVNEWQSKTPSNLPNKKPPVKRGALGSAMLKKKTHA